MSEPQSTEAQASGRGHFLGMRLPAPGLPWPHIVGGLIGVVLALALRYTLIDFKSVDYYSSLKPWYLALHSQGFSAFATDFSNYNPPYLYLLYVVVRFLPDVPMVVALKLPAIAADFACALLVYLLVRLKYPDRSGIPLVAGGALLLVVPFFIMAQARTRYHPHTRKSRRELPELAADKNGSHRRWI